MVKKMKLKKLLCAAVLAAMLCASAVVGASADSIYYADNCYYTYINNDKVALKGWENEASTVVKPPEKLNGRAVASVANRAFYSDSTITGIDFSDAAFLESIGMYAFANCSSLTEPIVLPESITEIGDCAFEASSVSEVVINASLEYIPIQCFYRCEGLADVTIDGPQEIDSYAFARCTNLSSVRIMDSVTAIHDTAFDNDPNLTIYCNAGSCAHTYAMDKGIPCVLLDSVLLGDATGDGNLNINDVTSIQRAVAEIGTLDDLRQKAADVNADGVVTIDDATILQMYLAEFATDYPIGEVTAQ